MLANGGKGAVRAGRIKSAADRHVTTQESPANVECGIDDPFARDPACVSERTLLRQTPEERAVCGKAARTDQCWGPPERAVPTTTDY